MFEKLARHFDLMTAMSRQAGVDLARDLAKGHVSATALRAATVTCSGCSNVCDCEGFLAGQPPAEEVPDYCLNRDMFSRLKDL